MAAEHVQTSGWVEHHGNENLSPPLSAHAAQVVAGRSNTADQDTTQTADNFIGNENVAGRRLLGGEQKGCSAAPILLACALCVCWHPSRSRETCCFHIRLVLSAWCCAVVARLQGSRMLYDDLTSCVAGWGAGFQEVTLQYLDANNKIVNTQAAVPSEWEPVRSALPLMVFSSGQGHQDTTPLVHRC